MWIDQDLSMVLKTNRLGGPAREAAGGLEYALIIGLLSSYYYPVIILLLACYWYVVIRRTSCVDRPSWSCVFTAHLLGCWKCVSSCVLYSSVGGRPRERKTVAKLSRDAVFFSFALFTILVFILDSEWAAGRRHGRVGSRSTPPPGKPPPPSLRRRIFSLHLHFIDLTLRHPGSARRATTDIKRPHGSGERSDRWDRQPIREQESRELVSSDTLTCCLCVTMATLEHGGCDAERVYTSVWAWLHLW